MSTAFQSNGFQNNAFQIDSGCTPAFQQNAFETDAFQTCVVCSMAFQINAYQDNAFQTCSIQPAPPTGGLTGKHHPPRRHRLEDITKSPQRQIRDILEDRLERAREKADELHLKRREKFNDAAEIVEEAIELGQDQAELDHLARLLEAATQASRAQVLLREVRIAAEFARYMVQMADDEEVVLLLL